MTAAALRNTTFTTAVGAAANAQEPAGAAQDDILIARITSQASVSILDDPTTHGWTEIKVVTGSAIRYQSYWIRRGASAPYLAFGWSGAGAYAVSIDAWQGAKTTGSPIGATNLPAATGTGTTLDSGSVTTTANDSVIITAGTHNNGSPAGLWSVPSGYTAIDITGDGAGAYMGACYKALTGGSGTSQDPGSMGTSGASDENYAITLELLSANPSGGGATSLLTPLGGFSHMLVR
jgi:hypothetical protein